MFRKHCSGNEGGDETMVVERWIRLIAGAFILISLALAHWVNPNWLWFTAFVGVNLFQSSLTRWCLMEDILVKMGIPKKQLPPANVPTCCSGS
jgi:hypothetical protein